MTSTHKSVSQRISGSIGWERNRKRREEEKRFGGQIWINERGPRGYLSTDTKCQIKRKSLKRVFLVGTIKVNKWRKTIPNTISSQREECCGRWVRGRIFRKDFREPGIIFRVPSNVLDRVRSERLEYNTMVGGRVKRHRCYWIKRDGTHVTLKRQSSGSVKGLREGNGQILS